MPYRCESCARCYPNAEVPDASRPCPDCGGTLAYISAIPEGALGVEGAEAVVRDAPAAPPATVEAKLQHFLDRTVRAGSRYGTCAGYGTGTWGYDAEHQEWTLQRRDREEVDLGPQIYFGCVGLVSSFLAYWYNHNEAAEPGWTASVADGISDVLAAPLTPSTVSGRENVRGFRPFIVDGRDLNVWLALRCFATISGTAASYINEGWLKYVQRRGGRYRFTWDAERFADVNVAVFNSHHVGLYVKRNPEGGPPRRDGTDEMWRLAADLNGRISGAGLESIGGITTWAKEELAFSICETDDEEHTNHFVVVRDPATEARFDTRITDEAAERLALPAGLRARRRSAAPRVAWPDAAKCATVVALWKLRDLRADGRAPSDVEYAGTDGFLDNPTRPIRPAL